MKLSRPCGETIFLSIITPNHNYGHFLADCLGSIAEQSGVSIEHILVDGESTDDSYSIARRFPQTRWIEDRKRGISHAINKGWDLAKGEWVMWLNADDRLRPGILSRVAEVCSASSADIVYGDIDFIDAGGAVIRRLHLPRWSMFAHVHHGCYVQSAAAFFRRASVIEPGFRLREDFNYVMDGEFYARLASAGKRFEHTPTTVAEFRMHGANASQRHLGRSRDMSRILAAEHQHAESRAIRRFYGVTLFRDPYLVGLIDGLLWILAKLWKVILRVLG